MIDDPKPTPDEIKAAAARLGLSTTAIYRRRANGWPWAKAMTEPKWDRQRSGRKGRRVGGWGVDFLLPGSHQHRRPGGRE